MGKVGSSGPQANRTQSEQYGGPSLTHRVFDKLFKFIHILVICSESQKTLLRPGRPPWGFRAPAVICMALSLFHILRYFLRNLFLKKGPRSFIGVCLSYKTVGWRGTSSGINKHVKQLLAVSQSSSVPSYLFTVDFSYLPESLREIFRCSHADCLVFHRNCSPFSILWMCVYQYTYTLAMQPSNQEQTY